VEIQTCSPTLSHTTIRYCKSYLDGGGVYIRDVSHPLFTDCEISHCTTLWGDGGGLLGRASSVALIRCVIRGNRTATTGSCGGGIALVSPADTNEIRNCTIENNVASNGGALFLRNRAWLTGIEGCVVRNNVAARGGAVFDSVALATVTNTLFTGNSADSGAAFYSTDASRLTVNFCTLYGNASARGAIFSRRDTLTLTNSILAHTGAGVGVQLAQPRAAALHHNDLFGNEGGRFAGDIPAGLGELTRTNLWGDSCDSQFDLAANPLFTDSAAGNYRLADTSRCLAAAFDPQHGVTADLDGLTRAWPENSLPDIGAYENRHTTAQANLAGSLRGTIGPGRFVVGGDIAVADSDTLVILPGTRLEFADHSTFTVAGVLRALGTAEDSIVFTADTLLNPAGWSECSLQMAACSLAFCQFSFASGFGVNILGGAVDAAHCAFDHCRGQWALSCEADSSHFADCLFSNNATVSANLWQSRARFERCEFSHNPAQAMTVGAHSQVQLSACTFQYNVSTNSAASGGAISFADSSGGTVEQCDFRYNLALYGGAVGCDHSNPRFEHCLFLGNAASGGGAACLVISPAQFVQCTMHGNLSSGLLGGGIYSRWSNVELSSTIISGSQGTGIRFEGAQTPAIRFCDFFGNLPGDLAGDMPVGLGIRTRTNARADSCDSHLNVFVNPQYADTAARDFHLTAPSHCINAGDSALPRDADGTVSEIGMFDFPLTGHPSLPFSLVSPGDDSVLTSDAAVTFIWHRSADPDFWDAVRYVLHIAAPDTQLTLAVGADSAIVVHLGALHIPSATPVPWWVEAESHYPEMTLWSDTLHFSLDVDGAEGTPAVLPRVFALRPASPNPFNPVTRLSYDLPRAAQVRLAVYDLLGREVAVLTDGMLPAGSYAALWNASVLPSGMYFVRLTSCGDTRIQKLLLLK
jgi:hypothetical protein